MGVVCCLVGVICCLGVLSAAVTTLAILLSPCHGVRGHPDPGQGLWEDSGIDMVKPENMEPPLVCSERVPTARDSLST